MEVNTQKEQLQYPGVVDKEGALQILLVSSSQQYLERLQKDLFYIRETQKYKRTYNLNVHSCKSISDIFNSFSPEEFKVDFVVFVLNLKNAGCFDEVEDELKSLKLFFGKEKICLVNPDVIKEGSHFQSQELWDFATMHQLNLICGKLMDELSAQSVSKRILNLAESCCGLTNGIPLVSYI